MTTIPLGSKILCRKVTTEETLPGGKIILLDERRELMTSQQAEVVEVGKDVELGLEPGDWVLHKDFARSWLDDDEHFVLKADDVICKLEIT